MSSLPILQPAKIKVFNLGKLTSHIADNTGEWVGISLDGQAEVQFTLGRHAV
jgi:hypothetical protein